MNTPKKETKENGSLAYIDNIINNAPAGIAVFSVNTSISVKNANDEFYRTIGFDDEQDFMINNGEDIVPLISAEDYERLLARFSLSRTSDDPFEYKMQLKKAEDEYIWILLKCRFIETSNSTDLFQVHITDVSRRQKMETELNSLLIKPSDPRNDEILFKIDLDRDIFTIPMRNLLGEERDIVVEHFFGDHRWMSFVLPKDVSRLDNELSKFYRYPNTGEIIFRRKVDESGGEQTYKIFYKNDARQNAQAHEVTGRIVNISEERESELGVEKSIRHDSITGFYNYENFIIRAKEIILKGGVRRSSVIILCINNMKNINSNFGSMFADTVIQNVSRKILTLVRETDVCGRLSQDTFAIWIKNVDFEIVYAKAKELCNSISSVYSGERENLRILSCAGISYGDGDRAFDKMFREAYSAMCYARKRENKCTVAYRENMPLVDVSSKQFEKELYYRIENYDVDMLSFAFGLLVNSRDIVSSINLLLQRIGERYNLDDILITRFDRKHDSQTITNCWSAKYGIREVVPLNEEVHDTLKLNTRRFDKKGMFIYNENENDEWPEILKKAGYHVSSMVAFAYYIDNKLGGFVCFIDESKPREWSEYVCGTFYEMVNILTIFLSINDTRQKDQDLITELSDRDRLTGLYNVDAFKKEAQMMADGLAEDDMLVMVFTDINNFAYINDTYGQEAGDTLLRDFGKYLGKRPNVSCRIYSDFFMTLGVAKPGNLEYSAILSANSKFERQTKKKFPLSNIKLSSGLFMFRPEECDIDTAMDNANMARKACKQNGDVGCVVYDETMRKTREQEQKFVGGLQSAIANGEFRLYLQPKFRLDTREVIGAEALSRWITPDGVVHYPDEFIPMFEKQGQIVQVDFFIYEQVLRLMNRWKNDGRKLMPVSVNFSRLNIHHDNFVDELKKLAQFYNISTDVIEIEITESAISSNDDDMIRVLAELRDNGFVVDMDDFGTGMSSLNMLLNAPVDIVKVDKSFLNNSLEKKHRKYIEYLAGLIAAADKEVIFEGVENEEQANFLIEAGYYNAQGFLFDVPIEAPEFERKYVYVEG